MAIFYREVTVDATAPTSPGLGEIWIKPVGSPSTYQGYIWIGAWQAIVSGGVYAAETCPDTHFINVIVQEDKPTDIIKPGWIWIKESISVAYIFIYDFMLLTGA